MELGCLAFENKTLDHDAYNVSNDQWRRGVLLSVDPLVQMLSRNKLFQVSLEQLALGGIMPTLFVVHAHSEATPCYS